MLSFHRVKFTSVPRHLKKEREYFLILIPSAIFLAKSAHVSSTQRYLVTLWLRISWVNKLPWLKVRNLGIQPHRKAFFKSHLLPWSIYSLNVLTAFFFFLFFYPRRQRHEYSLIHWECKNKLCVWPSKRFISHMWTLSFSAGLFLHWNSLCDTCVWTELTPVLIIISDRPADPSPVPPDCIPRQPFHTPPPLAWAITVSPLDYPRSLPAALPASILSSWSLFFPVCHPQFGSQ